jgi:regulatory protein
MNTPSENEMLCRMAAYCTAAERCVSDVEKKIQAAGLPAQAAERIIDTLLKEKFIDETRFARSFVSDKLRFNNWGRIKIGYELRRRNIPPTICREALEEIDEDAYRTDLLALLQKKSKTIRGGDPRDTYVKLLRFAAGRGFENEEINRCLRQLFKGSDYVDDMG